jgi:AraC-like DNA-binding protein
MRQSVVVAASRPTIDSLADSPPIIGDMKPMTTVARSSILPEIKRLALASGLDPLDLFKRAGIPRRNLENPELTLPVRAIVEVLEIAALTSGIDDFGLRLGEARGVPDLGPLILMFREAATGRDALRTVVSLLHMHTNGIYMHLDESSAPMFTLEVMAPDVGECRQAIDSGLAGMTHLIRWVLGEDWAPLFVNIMHRRPASKARYERFFRCPVNFMQDVNGIGLRPSDLRQRLSGSAPALRRQVERYIRSINVGRSDTYVHNVTEVLAMALPRGEANADDIARYLGTTRRTLNRRLLRAGLNYSTVMEGVRRNLASQYLRGTDRPLSDIAGLVGFENLSSFSRWYRRSFGQVPSKSRIGPRER